MREVVKKWYCIKREFNIHGGVEQEDIEGVYDTEKEAIKKAKRMWDYLTDKEKERNAIYVCMWHSIQDAEGEWLSIWNDDEEYQEGMSYAGAFDVAFDIDLEGEHEYTTLLK